MFALKEMAAKGEIVMLMFYDEAVCLTEVCRLCMDVCVFGYLISSSLVQELGLLRALEHLRIEIL